MVPSSKRLSMLHPSRMGALDMVQVCYPTCPSHQSRKTMVSMDPSRVDLNLDRRELSTLSIFRHRLCAVSHAMNTKKKKM